MSTKQDAKVKAARKTHGCEGFVIGNKNDGLVELRFPVKVDFVKLEPANALVAARMIVHHAMLAGAARPDWCSAEMSDVVDVGVDDNRAPTH